MKSAFFQNIWLLKAITLTLKMISLLPKRKKINLGSTVKLSSKDAMTLNSLFVTLNDKNQEKMDQKMMANKKGFEEILAFAKEAV
jgi:hypothetical protein